MPRRRSSPPRVISRSSISRGNAVSFTTSVERAFGSRLMAAGFILNNQLTDFSFAPVDAHGPVANRVQPGKRPRSSMTPTLIFDENGELVATLGSPGGPRIIGFVAQSVIALLDWGLDAQAALSLPRHVNRNGATELEAGTHARAARACAGGTRARGALPAAGERPARGPPGRGRAGGRRRSPP